MANNSIGRSCGIGATQSGKDWAQSNGLMPYKSELWLSFNNGLFIKYAAAKVFPVAFTGRGVVRKLLEKNAGGFANSLYKLRQDSKTAKPTDEAYKKMRGIEIQWLEIGGNPYELYESIDEGNKKTPTGAYFNKLMKMRAGGYTPNVAQWIAAGISVLFGKKYNETTGEITGNNAGIGQDPATGTASLLSSAPVWVQFVAYISGTLGTAYIVAKVGGPNDIPGGPNPPITPPGGNGNDNDGGGSGSRSMLLPIILIGGAAAAYFILKPSKK